MLQAFRQVEAGQDEAARESLQGIGLQSPFLEWKLLLRGLLAYYQGDDVRAVAPMALRHRIIRFLVDARFFFIRESACVRSGSRIDSP